jgi:hypothetical protein
MKKENLKTQLWAGSGKSDARNTSIFNNGPTKIYKKLIALLTAFVFTWSMCITPVMAEKIDVQGGSIDVDVKDNTTNWNVTGNPVWNVPEFNVPQGNIYNIAGLNQGASLALLVNGGQASNIFGTMNLSNLDFILQNIAGINIGASAMINLNNASLIASTLPLNTNVTDFLARQYEFSGQGGFLTNDGKIVGNNADLVALVANAIENKGTIEVPMGTVALAAGDTVTVGISGDGLVSIGVDPATANNLGLSAQIKNTGTISAEGGKVILNAQAMDGLFEKAISLENNGSAVSAITAVNGVIEFRSMDDIYNESVVTASGGSVLMTSSLGTVTNAGTVEADRGRIEVTARRDAMNEALMRAQEGLIKVNSTEGSVKNTGTIQANSGKVEVVAKRDIVNEAIMSGINGEIHAVAVEGNITNKGVMKADNGSIKLTSKQSAYNKMLLEALQGKVEVESTEAEVVNEGTIRATEGRAAMTARQDVTNMGTVEAAKGEIEVISREGRVTNAGTLTANAGNIKLTAEQAAYNKMLMEALSGKIEVTSKKAEIVNEGTMDARGGSVKIEAAGGVETKGVLKADQVTERGASFKMGGRVEVGTMDMDNLDNRADIAALAELSGDFTDQDDITVLGNFSLVGDTTIQTDSDVTNDDGTLTWSEAYLLTGNGYDLTLKVSKNSTVGAITGVDLLTFDKNTGKTPTYTGSTANDISVNTIKTNYGTTFTKNVTDGDGYHLIYSASNAVGGLQYAGTNTTTLGYNYRLANNLDISETTSWNSGAGLVPIGPDNITPYKGIFDGQGHTISNLFINRTGLIKIALFGWIDAAATVKNLNLENVNVTGDRLYVGGLASASYGTIMDCTVSGTVTGGESTGLLAGISYGSSAVINNSSSSGTVTSTSFRAGGLVGLMNGGTISNSHSSANVVSVSENYQGRSNAGGLVGSVGENVSTGAITNSYATGTVQGFGNYVGGLIGYYYAGSLSNSYATGNVTGGTGVSDEAGGLVGEAYTNGSISNSYATGNVNGTGILGGLIGRSYSAVQNTYATGAVTGGGINGGLIGMKSSGTVTSSYYDKTLHPGLTGEATYGKSTTEMMDSATFSGWDFSVDGSGAGFGDWIMAGLPHLQIEWSETITNLAQLQMMALDLDASYTLANNIDATATSTWNAGAGFDPVGYSTLGPWDDPTNPFTGDFNGAGHIIAGLTINREGQSSIGLFGATTGATITNVGLTGASVKGDYNTGGLVGMNAYSSSISNSYFTGAVTGYDDVGGLVGYNVYSSTVTNSHSSGTVTGETHTGGLVGFNVSASIADSYSSSVVTGTRHSTGGLVGNNDISSTISNSHFDGDVIGGGQYTGGLSGRNEESSIITGSYSTGTVTSDDLYTGGLVGMNDYSSAISNSHSTSTVNGTQYTGGLVGANNDDSTITTSYATGNVKGSIDFGGLVGYNAQNGIMGITSSYSHKVYNALDLQLMRYDLAGDFSLQNNIDASDTVNWNAGAGFDPIGDATAKFTGNFDGNSKVISGLRINRSSEDNVGLFGYANNASIQDLGLSSARVTGGTNVGAFVGTQEGGTISRVVLTTGTADSEVLGTQKVGGLVGVNSGAIQKSSMTGSSWVWATNAAGQVGAGGLVGDNSGTIENSYNASSYGAYGDAGYTGGLVGRNSGTITNSYNTGEVMGDSSWPYGGDYIGGLVGENTAGSITNSYSTGYIYDSNTHVGGLVGGLTGGTVTNSFYDSQTSGKSDNTGKGTPKTTQQMSSASTFTGWDFSVVGDGTIGNWIMASRPHLQTEWTDTITNATQLQMMAIDLGANYTLANDINASETATWNWVSGTTYEGFNPVGDDITRFRGFFDGNSKVITGLTINRETESYVGLFGQTSGATISDIGLSGINVKGLGFIGGLVGYNYNSTIENSFSSGAVTGAVGSSQIGGLVGKNDYTSEITHSYSTGTVTAGSGSYRVGGLVGYSGSTSNINNSYSTANVTGIGDSSYLGGLVGFNNGGAIASSHASGTVTGGIGSYNIGGLVGTHYNGGTINHSYASGTVTADDDSYQVGGLVGQHGTTGVASVIANSYSTSNVTGGSNSYRIGGLVGENSSSNIANSYSSGIVTGEDGSSQVGGIVGFNHSGDIANSFSSGVVTGGSGSDHIGGLVGDDVTGTYANNWYVSTSQGVSNKADAAGEVTKESGGLAAFMNSMHAVYDQSDPVNKWDFDANGISAGNDGVWVMAGLPHLQNEWTSTITTAVQLQMMALDLDANYTLANNIDASATSGWNANAGFSPVGYDTSHPFTGSFNGNNHTISGLFMNRGDYTGLFGVWGTGGFEGVGGTLQNVGLTGVNVAGSSYVGALVGEVLTGTLANVYSTGSVFGTGSVGGLIGRFGSGAAESTLSNSHSSATVTSTGGSVGGLIGSSWEHVSSSYATGNVSGTMGIGGLIGSRSMGSVTTSYATGDVTASGMMAGGLIGSNMGAVSYSFATGDVTGTSRVGGLVGNQNGGAVSYVFATGDVQGTDKVGGLIGELLGGSLTQSYAAGKVTASTNMGGLVGYDEYGPTYTSNFWNTTTSGTTNGIGNQDPDPAGVTGKTTAQMMQQGTFSGWDFTVDGVAAGSGDWIMVGMPHLQAEWSNTITSLAQLQMMALNLDASYTLANNIDATETSTWNSGAGFASVGTFTGVLDGGNHYVSNLRSGSGLFSVANGGGTEIKNLRLINTVVSGGSESGAVAGVVYDSAVVRNVYASGTVNASYAAGGLVGTLASGMIYDSGADVDVSSPLMAGGLAGCVGGGSVGQPLPVISRSYSLGDVNSYGGDPGWARAGGIIGWRVVGSVYDSYAAGLVTSTGAAGGLIGSNSNTSITSNSYWDVNTTGQATSSGGGTGLTTLQMMNPANYTGWDISSASGHKWIMVNYPHHQAEWSTDITDVYQLQLMALDLDAHYTLADDIDASATSTWNGGLGFDPVGYSTGGWGSPATNPFTGSFDGAGHTITGLTISRAAEQFIGLFGWTTGASISNVGLENASVEGYSYVGSLAGINDGSSAVSSSHATGSITSHGSFYDGDISGGLVGWNKSSSITSSYYAGTVTGSGMGSLGGLVGYNGNSATITSSYATGSVSGSGYCVGGLVGSNGAASTIISSYATGSVSNSGNIVGGLVGGNYGGSTISDSYSTGSVVGYDAGGLVGENEGSVNNSFWDIETSGKIASAGGTGKTTAEMQGALLYGNAGWDIFTPVWDTFATTTPHLSWENYTGATENNIWSGNAGTTNWATPANWSMAAAPTAASNVYIFNRTDDPVLTATSNVNNLTIASGGVLGGASYNLNVAGDWTNDGTFNAGTGTVDFTKATGTQTLDSGGIGVGKAFNNLTHSGAGTLQIVNHAADVNGTLTNSNASGVIDLNGQDFYQAGAINNAGIIDDVSHSAGTFTLDGPAGTYDFKVGIGFTPWNFVVNGTGTWNAHDGQDFWSWNDSTLTSGTLNITDSTGFSSHGNTLINGGTLTGVSDSYFTFNFYDRASTFTISSGSFTAPGGVDIHGSYIHSGGTADWITHSSNLIFWDSPSFSLPNDTYYDLSFVNDSSGTISLSGATTVTNDLMVDTTGFTSLTLALGSNFLSVGNNVSIGQIGGYNAAISMTSGTLNVGGNWTNSGTFTPGTGTVTFNGTGAQTLTSGGTGAGKNFHHVVINNTGSGVTVSGNDVTQNAGGVLGFTQGALDLNGHTWTLGGSFAPAPTAAAVLNLDSAGSVLTGGFNYYVNLTNTNMTVTQGQGTLTSSSYSHSGGTHTVSSGTINTGDFFTSQGIFTVTGDATVNVSGNVSISWPGSFNAGTSTFVMTGANKVINASMWSLYDLTIQGGSVSISGGDLYVNDFDLASGSFNQSSHSLGLEGNFTLESGTTYTKASGGAGLYFYGDGVTYTDNTVAKQNVGNVRMTGSSNVSMQTDLVADSLQLGGLGSGALTTNNHELTVGSGGMDIRANGALYATEGTVNVNGALANNGTISGGSITNNGTWSGTGSTSSAVLNYGTISSGTFSNNVDNGEWYGTGYNYGTINGGTFSGGVSNFGSAINGGDFNGNVNNYGGTISGGTFNSSLDNNGTISGDNSPEFNNDVNNYGTISGGTFTGSLDQFATGSITGGNFSGIRYLQVDYDAIWDYDTTVGGSGAYIANYGTISGGTFGGHVDNNIPGIINGGTFNGSVTNIWHIFGGTFNGSVANEEEVFGGTYNSSVTNTYNIWGGTFNNSVTNSYGIHGGTYDGTVTNDGTIENGTFNGAVTSNWRIHDGTFNGIVNNNGEIYSGTLNGAVTGIGTVEVTTSGGSYSGVLNGTGSFGSGQTFTIRSDGTVSGSLTINGTVTNYGTISGGTFSNTVTNNSGGDQGLQGGVFTADGSVTNNGDIIDGEFNGSVNNSGTISGGTFQTTTVRTYGNSVINGGTFSSSYVDNYGILTINDGLFNFAVHNSGVLTVNDGTFNGDGVVSLSGGGATTINNGHFAQPVGGVSSIAGGEFNSWVEMCGGNISGGTFLSDLTLYNTVVDSGTFSGVKLRDTANTINGGTFGGDITSLDGGTANITGGEFNGSVANNGTISGGTFNNTVTNYGAISGGTFNGYQSNSSIENHGTIESGWFNSYAMNYNDGLISGGTFADCGGNSHFNYGTIEGGTFSGNVENYGSTTGGTFLKRFTHYGLGSAVSGGDFSNLTSLWVQEGATWNYDAAVGASVGNWGTISAGIYSADVGNISSHAVISGGTFNGSVINEHIVSGGTFNSTVDNNGTISGGTFGGVLTNEVGGTISGGTFNGTVGDLDHLFGSGTINDGMFYGAVYGNDISGGTFNNSVYAAKYIDGTFNGPVLCSTEISGGTFNGDVSSIGLIVDGTFNGAVTIDKSMFSGIVTGGTFTGSVVNLGTIAGGTFTLTGDYSQTDGSFSGVTAAMTAANLDLQGGTFESPNMTISGAFKVSGGTFTSGAHTVTLQSANASYKTSDVDASKTDWTGGTLNIQSDTDQTLPDSEAYGSLRLGRASGTGTTIYTMGSGSTISGTGTIDRNDAKVRLAISATGIDRVYNATTAATVNFFDNRLTAFSGDYTISGTASFTDKNVGNDRAVNVSDIALSGTDAVLYDLVNVTASTTANVTKAAATLSGITASDKIYDQTTGATVSAAGATFAGKYAGDTLTVSSTGTFSDKNAGTAKTVNLSNILGGADLGNYNITDQATTTADITKATVTLSGITASNKVYDQTAAATVSTAGATFAGKYAGDVLTVSSTGAFADKNVANGKTVNLSNALGGTDLANYTVIDQVSTTANITKAAATLSGLTASNKVYDSTTGATVSTAGATFSGKYAGDDLTVSSAGTFSDKNVANGKTVTLANTLGGADLGNYTITDQGTTTANITKAAVTLSGITASNKVYDSTTGATTSTAGATFAGKYAGDVLTVASSTGVFSDKNVANGKTVTLTNTLGGADLGNYTVTDQGTTTANITAKAVTLSGITASNKVYDQTTGATVSTAGATFAGKYAGDVLTVSSIGVFGDKNVANGKTVTLTNALGGADFNNYTITDQGTTTANITAKTVTLSGITAGNKVYDSTTDVTVSAAGAAFTGKIAGDDLTVSSTGVFSDKNAGTGKQVDLTNVLGGADLANYMVIDQQTTTANITAKSITLSGITASNKVYDGTTDATVSTAGATFTGKVAGDTLTVTSSGVFGDKNVASGKTVTLSNTLGGADLGNYTISEQGTTTANITAKSITLSGITASNKVYDGTTAATVTLSDDRVAGDVLIDSYGAATFANKNVGVGKAVSVTGLSISGADAANYTLASTTDTASANITARTLTLDATGVNRVYDGTTAATVTLSDDRVAGDVLTGSYGAATFANKNVGVGKAVSVTGLAISGADVANYTLSSTTDSTTANITARTLTLDATGVNRVYDGTTVATVTLSDDRVAGDILTGSYSAAFADKNVGTGKAVSVTGLSISGIDASNYALSSTTDSTTADISAKVLTVTGATAQNKVYDSTTAATISGATLSGVVGTEDVSLSNATVGTFASKNVGTGIAVSTLPMTLTGADIGNYTLTQPVGLSANITARTLTLDATGVSRVYDGTTAATVTLSDDRVAGDVLTGSYSAAFADKNVGTGKAVSVTGLSISGIDASNYALSSTTDTTSADITVKAVTLSGITASNKVYDATTDATVSTAGATFTGMIGGDDLTVDSTGVFIDKNVGVDKTVLLTNVLGGVDLANYQVTNQPTTTADIEAFGLSIVSLTGSRVYDGTTNVAAEIFTLSQLIGIETLTLSGVGTVANKNVGTNKVVTLGTLALGDGENGGLASNYTLTGGTHTVEITRAPVMLSGITAGNKVYDQTTAATISTAGAIFAGMISGDDLTVGSTGTFSDKNVGTEKIVTLSNTLGGVDLNNYTITNQGNTTADITAKTLTVSGATAQDKAYNGNTVAVIAGATLNGVIGTEDVSLSNATSGTFASKNIGTGIAVSTLPMTLTGADIGNYTLTQPVGLSANITAKVLTVTGATAQNKVYDSTTAATISGATLSGVVGTEDVSLSNATSGTFASKNVGTGIAVSTLPMTLTGADIGNYTLTQPVGLSANITARTLTLDATGVNRVYDGTTTATVALSDDRVAGDVLTGSYSAAFADKNVGTGKAVSVTGLSISGIDASNYALSSTTDSTTADISAKVLTVTGATAQNKVYDSTTAATISGATLSGVVGTEDVSLSNATSGTFASKNVGTGIAVSTLPMTLTGADIGNYTLTQPVGLSANITARTLTLDATGVNRVYDGTTTATVSLTDNRIAGDVLTGSYGAASFIDKNVGTGKAVSVTGLSISGDDAANYSLVSTTDSTTANITARTLTLDATGVNRVYDGTTMANVSLSDDRVAGDSLTGHYGPASFADKNVGVGKVVTVTGLSITGTDASNYTLSSTTDTTSANITARTLTMDATGVDRVYDGTIAATVALSDNRISGDVLTGSYDAASFINKNVGVGKAVNVTGISISGSDASNYALSSTTDTTTANITARTLTLDATGVNRTYDGTTNATVTLTDDRIAGDVLTGSYGAASFIDKNVGTGKVVSVTDLSISGADASNYELTSTTDTASANIFARTLTLDATGVNRVYDGTTVATVTLSDDRVAGDVLTGSYSAAFADKNVGTGKAVSVTGLSISGADAANYTLASTTDATTADITARTLTLDATGVNRTYDGTTNATVTLADDRVAGDVLIGSYGAASFIDKNAGTGKVVDVTGLSISGTDASNYELSSTTDSTTANITKATATLSGITASNKVYDQTATATVSIVGAVFAGKYAGDVLSVSSSGVFSDKNAGTGKTVTLTNAFSGGDLGNYTIIDQGTTTADITKAVVTLSGITATNKVYDATTAATVSSAGAAFTGKYVGDVLTVSSTGVFSNKNVGTGKTVTLTNTFGGTDLGNYNITDQGMTTANITVRDLTIAATGIHKVYDGTAAATVMLSDNRVASDVLTPSYTTAAYADESVGTSKPVTVSGISLSGVDSYNYAYNETAVTLADITPVPVAIIPPPVVVDPPPIVINPPVITPVTPPSVVIVPPPVDNVPLPINITPPTPVTPPSQPVTPPSQPVTPPSQPVTPPESGTQTPPATSPSDTTGTITTTKDQGGNGNAQGGTTGTQNGAKDSSTSTQEEKSEVKQAVENAETSPASAKQIDQPGWRDVPIWNTFGAAESKKFLTDVRVIEGAVYVLDGANAMSLLGMGDSMRVLYKKHFQKMMKAPKKVIVKEAVSKKAPESELIPAKVSQEPTAEKIKEALVKIMERVEEPEVAPAPEARVLKSATPIVMQQTKTGDRYGTLKNPGKDVFVKSRGGDWKSAKDGMVILPGDEVKTAERNSVEVLMDGGKVGQVEIKEGSLFRIQKAETDPATGDKSTILDLAMGKILVKVEALKGNSKFEVRTPTALTGVRGTVFEVTVKEKA